MTATLDGAATVVASLGAAVDSLLKAELSGLSTAQLTAMLAGVEVQRRRLAAVDAHLVGEVVLRGVAGEIGASSPAVLLTELLHVSPGEARARVTRAVETGPRRALTGELLAPIFPTLAGALRDGAVSGAHADVIIRETAKIPLHLQAEFDQVAETPWSPLRAPSTRPGYVNSLR